MLDCEAVIFLSENRECFQTENFRSFETIKQNNAESQIISIAKFSDNTLSAQNFQQILVDDVFFLLLIPLVGALEIFDKNDSNIVNAGEIACVFMKPDEYISIQNPYKNELINYLEIWIKRDILVEHKMII